MARRKRDTPGDGSFAWPGRKRSAELELAANRAAEQGLKRLRERRPVGGPVPPPDPAAPAPGTPSPLASDAPQHTENGGAPRPSAVAQQDPPAPAEPAAEAPAAPAPSAPDLWETDFNSLADELADELRRDLGPSRG